MKKKIYKNDIRKIFKNFITDYNLFYKKENDNLMSNTKNKYIIFGSKDYEYIYFGNVRKDEKWRNYYITHSIEYRFFIRYLKENNIYEKFIYNHKKQNILFSSFNFIGCGLTWDKTEEGFEFWEKEYSKWCTFFYNCVNIINI